MASPGWIARRIRHQGGRLLEWSDRWTKRNLDDVPMKSGIYALYHGTTLQYIGRSLNLLTRLKRWEQKHYYKNEYVPFGSYAWFNVPKNQLSKIEDGLIGYYQPPYNVLLR